MLRIAWLPGDGVGREVTAGPARILEHLAGEGLVEVTGPWPVGATALVHEGELLPVATRAACDAADAILLGAVGDDPRLELPEGTRPELALIELRRRYDLRVSVRNVWLGDSEIVVVRNLLGGAYGTAEDREEGDAASDRFRLTAGQIAELAGLACDHAEALGGLLVSVDKANLLATSRLWRRVVGQVCAERGVEVTHLYVDRAAYEFASRDAFPDVVLAEGLFGDILSDLLSGRAGSPALCGSASINPGGPTAVRCRGLYEPAHGSAPRRAGRNQVSPLGGFLGLVSLLRSRPETAPWAERVRNALTEVSESGPWTRDLAPAGQPVSGTSEVTDRVVELVRGPVRRVAPAAPPPARWDAAALERWSAQVLERAGLSAPDADVTAEVLAYADLGGIDSHGIVRLPAYARLLEEGIVRADVRPEVVRSDGAVALVDAHDTLGAVASAFALRHAEELARTHGVGWVNVRSSSHHGACGYYVREAARRGFVALAATNTGGLVAAAGSTHPYLGTNPLAFGAPVAGEDPFVLDLATSAVAGGKFEIALREGASVPLGWGLDARGAHATDPAAVYREGGSLLPLGSFPELGAHKGFGLGLLVEVLTAVLAGGPTGPAVGNLSFKAAVAAPAVSHVLVVLEPGRLGGVAEVEARLAALLAELRALPAADATNPVRTPGQRRAAETRARSHHGVPLAASTVVVLTELAERYGVAFPAPVES
ncbi:Ldh family oxidoreductase [Microbacterium sp. X-17]|uniref:Ldh family oxidoreductase n=1 Tax=Microbacterium sp. X-17 TaxID=3144404 RepID=UPI0031F5CEAA